MKKLENDTHVTELQFAERYLCSRAALRSALAVLEQEGLIRVMPNGTKRICSLTTKDINDLYEFRTYIECSALRQALTSGTLDISKLIQVIEEAQENDDFLDCDAKFHETLVAMSNNKALLQAWKTFAPVTRELFSLNFSHSQNVKDAFHTRHMLIIKMLLDRDEAVIDVLRSHIDEAKELSLIED
ncbi:MAG: GntR family transcriptional regulator [Clostridia bacterium]|nr:GntR family transcriptional regulator [Clostridia bacterium]